MSISANDEKPSLHQSEKEPGTPSDPEHQQPEEELFKWDLAICTNLLALFMCYFSSTWGLLVPTSSIAFIVEQFPDGAGKSAWIAAAVSIPNCVLQAFMGELSDILGRKHFLLAGMLLGITGAIVSSRANNVEMIIGGQVLNGCGLTLGYLAIPLVSEVVPKDKRPQMQGLAGVIAGIATMIGPVIQGAFIKNGVGGDTNGWRGGFYLCAGFYALTFISLVLFYHPAPRPGQNELSTMSRVAKIDWLGVFLVASGLVLFLVGLHYGGNPYEWTDPLVLCTLIIGGVLLMIFGIYNWRFRKDGLLHHAFFEHRNFAISMALNFVGGIVLFGGQAYLPQEIVTLFTNDAILTGVYNIPFNGFSIISAFIAGIIMGLTKEAKPIVITAFSFLLAGSGIMAVMEPHINFAAWFFPTALLGFGVGAQLSILNVVVSVCTANEYIAHAMSVVAAVRALGGSIGIVIFHAIFYTKTKEILPKQLAKAVLVAGLPQENLTQFLTAAAAGVGAQLLELPGVTEEVIEAYRLAYPKALADCYRFIWYSLIPFAAVSLGISFFLKTTKAQMTRQVAAGVQRRGIRKPT